MACPEFHGFQKRNVADNDTYIIPYLHFAILIAREANYVDKSVCVQYTFE